MNKVLLAILVLSLAGCGKTCEEKGGEKIRIGGYIQMIQYSKGISTPIWITDYKCVGAAEEPMPKAYRNIPGERWWEQAGSVK